MHGIVIVLASLGVGEGQRHERDLAVSCSLLALQLEPVPLNLCVAERFGLATTVRPCKIYFFNNFTEMYL